MQQHCKDSPNMRKVVLQGAPSHMERVGRILLAQRKDADFSACDLRIELDGGFELVHSAVIGAHSARFSSIFSHTRPPYAPYDMTNFSPRSAQKVIDWMYSGEMQLNAETLRDDLLVAAHLRASFLLRQIEHHLKKLADVGHVIFALNIASTEGAMVTEETMAHLMLALHDSLETTSLTQLKPAAARAIATNSLLPACKKTSLINALVGWSRGQRPDVVQDVFSRVVIRDVKMDDVARLRRGLVRVLLDPHNTGRPVVGFDRENKLTLHIENPQEADENKVEPTASPSESSSDSNTELLKEDSSRASTPTSTASSSSEVRPTPPTRVQIDVGSRQPKTRHGGPCPYTRSEVELINGMPNPFDSTSDLSSRTASDSHTKLEGEVVHPRVGPPIRFSKSEVSMIRAIPDPFGPDPTRSPSAPPNRPESPNREKPRVFVRAPDGFQQYHSVGLGPNRYLYTQSEAEDIQAIPDVFSSGSRPTSPCVSSVESAYANAVKPSGFVTMPYNYRPDFIITSSQMSPGPRTNHHGLHKTASEVLELEKIPPISQTPTRPNRQDSPKAAKMSVRLYPV
ncbi:unnamed protein product [Caenorhabditis auriculariae]|uniref:BTB domain-containing protein n=1 Tax=Caenorhabditis auriculariae TaxID=2777116 RepID=A0A8S1H335_9PELO|nr:unnamed protein product [Caenorhabditis auriculariae]